MSSQANIREEELKNRVATAYFGKYDCDRIVGDIDFCVLPKRRDPRQMMFIPDTPILVPQDVRERKGSFFTPAIWVEKSQQYLAVVLGENWQDEYYVNPPYAEHSNRKVIAL